MKKICVVSGTRADYSLLFWVMKEIQMSKSLELQIVVTGMHLSKKFGNTWKNFSKDGFQVNERVDLGILSDSRNSIAHQIAEGLTGFFKAFSKLKPDLVIILGDRYEMLAAAQSAMLLNCPIAHIHGGEITEGAFDDFIRHSISKMSSYHFTSTDIYRKRVIQMGEHPSRVLNVGAPGLDSIKKIHLLSKQQFEEQLNFKLRKKNFLITYHPVTAALENGIDELLSALDRYAEYGQIITLPNSDPGHDSIIKAFKKYASKRPNVFITPSLGQVRFLSAMKICDIVIGNSSSGIIEAPFQGTPTLNIGIRQKGRLRAESVTDVSAKKNQIINAINRILDSRFKPSHLYGRGNSSQKIIRFLEKTELNLKTSFYDLG